MKSRAEPPPSPMGLLWAFLYLGVEDSKRTGNEVNHLAAFDPNVEDHTLNTKLGLGQQEVWEPYQACPLI